MTRANAVQFTGGTNSLTLQAGFSFTGNVVAFSALDTLALGGSANATFDVSPIGPAAQYQGFGVFQKTGPSTWTLSGTPGTATPWTINGGILQINAAASVGSGFNDVTVNRGGVLATGFAVDQSFIDLHLNPSSAGVLALAVNNANPLDFGSTGPSNLSLGAVGNVTYSGTLGPANDGAYRLGGGGGTLTVTSLLSGSNRLIVGANGTTPGTVMLPGANTYTGGTTIADGTLAVGNNAALGTGSVIAGLSLSGTETLQAAANGLTIANDIALNNNLVVDTQGNALTLSGGLFAAGQLPRSARAP